MTKNKIFNLLFIVLSIFLFVGCATVQPVQESVEETVIEEAVIEESAVSEPVIEPVAEPLVEELLVPEAVEELPAPEVVKETVISEPVVEPIIETVIEEPEVVEVVAEPVPEAVEEPEVYYKSYDFYGYQLDFYAAKGYAILTYPSIFTADDVFNVLVEISDKYDSYLKDVSISVYGDAIEFVFPESYGFSEFKLAESILSTELINYMERLIDNYLKSLEPVAVEPVVEQTIEEPVQVEEPKVEPIKLQYNYAGYRFDFLLEEGKGSITYPSVFSKLDVEYFLSYVVSEYGAYLKGLTYSFDENKLIVNYPETYGEKELALVKQMFLDGIDGFVAKLTEPVEKEVEQEVVVAAEPVAVESVVEQTIEEPVKVEEVKVEPIKLQYNYAGYRFDFLLEEGKGSITYPSVFSKLDVEYFLSYVASEYGAYLNGVTYSIEGDKVIVNYPQTYGEKELALVQQMFQEGIDGFVAKLTKPVEEVVEQEVVVAVEPVQVEEVLEIIPVTEEITEEPETVQIEISEDDVTDIAPVVELPVAEDVTEVVHSTKKSAINIVLVIILVLLAISVVFFIVLYRKRNIQ